ncbi:MAG: ADP-ribosylglycohydrolase family protein [Nitrospinaceae bacterium]|nr:ADP-ribosylglycohydrolase family protein [Nitrospinaceae bacterium]NIR55803.1 ADP-ribosylglycohydrolase family protein [Nitrospinaceae bacterium]NIS86256.1 ADP-ribosylglycohydrolase family protein [Nitrospinaceae bacterium]NIT83085.1 ADP-ribosylglycohydrolase family protein [Nitrospinaceae bacterium]NIU45295.1 ADP-ribosylglycohydrolase family protein [Nitrospinaceae bacterium]
MLGAIAGDIIGSRFEWNNHKSTDFELFHPDCRFTDDTVLTVAVAEQILYGSDPVDLFKEYARRYPDAGFGGRFAQWAASPSREPYNSYGNGSAMRVSPVGFAFDSLDEVRAKARHTAAVTHNHPEGIKGAQATAAAVFLARTGQSKAQIKSGIEAEFQYDLNRSLDRIRPEYAFDVTCQGSVPQAITAFLESENFENAIRLAVSLGGDSDTLACITGGIAHAFYREIPDWIVAEVYSRLDSPLRQITTLFSNKFARL